MTVVFENSLPAFVNVFTIMKIRLIQLIFEPAIDPEFRVALFGHAGKGTTETVHSLAAIFMIPRCPPTGRGGLPEPSVPLPRSLWM